MSGDRLDALLAAKKAHGEAFMRNVPAGHKCGPITVTQDEWDALEIASLKEKAARSALLPTEQDAINMIAECHTRLKELGWNDAIYCPKDGSEFDAIEVGSTGIHRCHYSGEWPEGRWWIADEHDLWPSRPIMYRVSEEEKARWRDGGKKLRAMMASGEFDASVDTLPKGGDAKQAPCESKGSAVTPKAADAQDTPND